MSKPLDNVRTLRTNNSGDLVHSCATCVFQEMQPVAMPDGKPVIGQEQMVCKRFPPQVVALQVPTAQGISVQLMPVFPPVNASTWCFEHEPCDASQNGTEDVS